MRKLTPEQSLQRAHQKYLEYSRNYNYYKDRYEDFYYNENTKESKRDIKDIESRMNHAFDMLQTLVYIFGEDVR